MPDRLEIQNAVMKLWRDLYHENQKFFELKRSVRNQLTDSRIRAMIQYIQDHYAERIMLKEIAFYAHVSSSEALRCFHQFTGTTPVDYLIQFRLNKARELLISTSDSVSVIAGKVGIDNISYFPYFFQKIRNFSGCIP